MNGNRWDPDGPPPEAYSRITNPERFQALHQLALDLLQRLETEFDVQREEGHGLDPDLECVELARPTVRLTPADATAAPIVIAFTAFPGLMVRCGRWLSRAFPACGCDACDETATGEGEQFLGLIDDVVRGRFRESITLSTKGTAWHGWERGPSGRRSRGGSQIETARARELVGEGESEVSWRPWTTPDDPGPLKEPCNTP